MENEAVTSGAVEAEAPVEAEARAKQLRMIKLVAAALDNHLARVEMPKEEYDLLREFTLDAHRHIHEETQAAARATKG